MDGDLASRVRALMPRSGVTEKRMFGGIAFLLNGNLIMGASWRHLMVRVGRDAHEAAAKRPGVRPMEMRGRVFTGYVKVDPTAVASDAALRSWVDKALAHGKTLPAKAVKPGKVRKATDDGLPLPPPLERARAATSTPDTRQTPRKRRLSKGSDTRRTRR